MSSNQDEIELLKLREIAELLDSAISCWNAKELRSRYNTNHSKEQIATEEKSYEDMARKTFFKAKSLLLEDKDLFYRHIDKMDNNQKDLIGYLYSIINNEITEAAESSLLDSETIKDQE